MKEWIGLFGALMAASLISAQAQTMSQGKAEVRAIHGKAQYSIGGNVWMPLKVGTVLKSGSIVKTAADSSVDCFLGSNGPVLRITADTQLAFDKLVYSRNDVETVIETNLNLDSGRILGNVKKLAAASHYEVKAGDGIVGIRGTDYEIKVTLRGDGRFDVTITCITGQVVGAFVAAGLDRTVVLGSGQQYNSLTMRTIMLSQSQLKEYKKSSECVCFSMPLPTPIVLNPEERPLTGLVGIIPQNSAPSQ